MLPRPTAVLVVNRVKPHTDFHGEVESGLVKMLVIGAGKHAGALTAHRLAVRHGFPADAARPRRTAAGCAAGALRAGHRGGPARRHGRWSRWCEPGEFFTAASASCSQRACELFPTAARATSLDVLVVDWLGKDVSGTGMDTNVIGRVSVCGPWRPAGAAAHHQDLRARPHGRHPRQRLRHRHGRLHHAAHAPSRSTARPRTSTA